MARRKDYLTLISVVCAISVLTLHTNGCFWDFSATEKYWKTANIIESVFYFAVPLFFILSSVTLIDYQDRYSLKEYFLKRLHKAMIPFVIWSLFGLAGILFLKKVARSDLSLIYIIDGIVNAKFVPMFWFFSSLFTIYLCMPLFAAVKKSKRRECFTYLSVSAFVLNILLPFLHTLFEWDIDIPYSIQVASGALYWIPFGWLLDNTEFSKKQRYIIYFLGLVGLIVHTLGTYVFYMKSGEVVRTFKGYNSLTSVLYSSGVFVLLKQIGKKTMVGGFARFINWLSGYTYPIYLMQFFLLSIFPKFPFVDGKSIIYQLGGPYVMIPIIILITTCLRKIPFLCWIVP